MLDDLIHNTDERIIRRVLMYLTGHKDLITLHKIGRDGKGVDYSVNINDTGAFKFLCSISLIYPAALTLRERDFKVNNGPLLFAIAEHIRDMSIDNNYASWPIIPGDSRALREYQQESVNDLVGCKSKGKIIWIEVGMGKTLILMTYIKHCCHQGIMPKYLVYTLPASAVDSIKRELGMFGIPFNQIDMRKGSKNNTLIPFSCNLIIHDHMRMNGMDEQMRNVASDMFFVCDEFHLCLSSKTIRTSIALEISKLSSQFVAMSGTILNSSDGIDELIAWLEQVVPYHVTPKNYFVAVGSLISKKVRTNVLVERINVDVAMEGALLDAYKQYVPVKLGGNAHRINIHKAVNICYEAVSGRMVDDAMLLVNNNQLVFMVANNMEHQQQLKNALVERGLGDSSIHLITSSTPITLTPNDQTNIKVVITTIRHTAGYTLTKSYVMLTSVYFSNESSREQLEGRINRIGQLSPTVYFITYHTGILSYIHDKYKKTRNMSEILKSFAKDVN